MQLPIDDQADAAVAATPAAGRSRGLYTYLVSAQGPITTVEAPGSRPEVVLHALLSRNDGTARRHVLRIAPTEAQPDLPTRVSELLSKGVPVRMVVRFEQMPTDRSRPAIRVQAVAERLLEPARAPQVVQLDLFA